MEWSEELAGGLLRAAPDGIIVMVPGGQILLVNDRAEAMFGYPHAELVGQPAQKLLAGEYPHDPDAEVGPGSRTNVALTLRRRDGSEFPAEACLSTVVTPQGQVVVAVIRDISERVSAEQEKARLRADADRQRVEVQLHRTQRLESLGQLAGGIAHDFNNMLGVIVNYAGFVIEESEAAVPDLQAIVADAQQVVRAGERGTELTHQLLAFARREVVRPKVLDLNEVIVEVEQLLRHSIGEHITLSTQLAEGLPLVCVDPGQIEQLLVNLVLNARDAMPGGGQMIIDTDIQQVTDGDSRGGPAPGEYVRLRVVDSGTGMARDVVERAFEPFFTTKANGEGAGLGLAAVHGIVVQAGGGVSLASEQGVGSTVTVLLPPTDESVDDTSAPASADVTTGHGETVLVVEDEAALREMAGRILSGAGYQVLCAESGPAALELAASHQGTIDLLVSDVVMPGMLGKDLAERLVAVRPDTPVLFISGYAHPVLASQGTLDPGVVLLEKPFTAGDLLSAVRHRLDARVG